MTKKVPFYEKKAFYIPAALLLGILGFSPMLVSLLGKKEEEEWNSEYYSSAKEPLFKQKRH